MVNGVLGLAESFVWWQGVVEDRHDPLGIGRCRVRIFGFHTKNKKAGSDDDPNNFIPTNELPWAFPMMPLTSSNMNGQGQAPLGPVEGTWVLGFFRDGENCQDPVMMGTINSGFPVKPPDNVSEKGFWDARTDELDEAPKLKSVTSYVEGEGATYDEESKPPRNPRTPGENSTNKLALGETDAYPVPIKKENTAKGIQTALEGLRWTEPPTAYKSKYPYNHVTKTESGHIFEADDTPGAERLHQFHRSGTFEEIHPNGDKVTKFVGDGYEIHMKGKNVYVAGTCNITVVEDANILVSKDANVVVGKNLSAKVQKNMTVTVEEGNALVQVKAGTTTVESKGSITVSTEGDMDITSSGRMNLDAGGPMTLTAPRIDLN